MFKSSVESPESDARVIWGMRARISYNCEISQSNYL